MTPPVVDLDTQRRYVFAMAVLAAIGALAVDAAAHLLFATGWTEGWREAAIATFVVIVVAIPVARAIGRAQRELQRSRQQAARLSRIDATTGLANRRALYEAAARLGDGDLTLAILDIDRLKRMNDRYGHAVGDEIVREVAARLRAELGDLGTVARLGGEEFALLTARRPAGEVRTRLEQFRQSVAGEAVPIGGQALYATVSIGFVARSNIDFDALYAAADKALQVAKSAGRDRVVDYDHIGEIAAATQQARAR